MIRAVLFDWGDTVMRVFPGARGPMASWPEVAPIPGIADAIAALRPAYRIALVTNAEDSDRAVVEAALARVGLRESFDHVFTSRDLGARKPDRAFFDRVLEQLGLHPPEAMMVGDHYENDVLGARRAGIYAVWFNPGGALAPRGRAVPQVGSLADLPRLIASLEASQRTISQAGAG